MPYRNPQIFLQPINIDYGDDNWVDTTQRLLEYIRDRMIMFDFSDHSEKIDELKIAFHNSDHELTDFPSFVVGQKFRVAWGWPGNLCEPRQMIVAKREPGDPHVVWLRDPMIMLAQRAGYYHRSNITDSEWVRQIAEEWGYTGPLARIQETTRRGEITQPKNRTDAEQLHRLAIRNGFEVYIDGSGLYWGPRQLDAEPVEEFIWRTDPRFGTILQEPSITQNTDRGAAQVIVEARDPLTKESITVKVSASTSNLTALGQEIELDDPVNSPGSKRVKRVSRIKVRPVGYMNEDEAKLLAQAYYRDEVQGMYKIKFPIIGDPRIMAKRLFRLTGHSKSYDGLYYIREARHVIRPGQYTVEVNGERDALTEVRVEKKARRPIVNKFQSQNTTETSKDENTARTPEGEAPLQRKLTVTINASGNPTASWMFVADANDTVGQTRDLTQEELAALSEKTLRALARQGVQTTLPDV